MRRSNVICNLLLSGLCCVYFSVCRAQISCKPLGDIGDVPVINTLGEAGDLSSCIDHDPVTGDIRSVFIEFPASMLTQLPARVSSGQSLALSPPPMTQDGKPISDLQVCNIKTERTVETCAKGYRAFGELPETPSRRPFGMTLVSWDNLGLFQWHDILNEPLLGFHFYFHDTSYRELLEIHPGWSSDAVHVEANSNYIVQRSFPDALIPVDYIRGREEGSRAGVGGLEFDLTEINLREDVQKSHQLLWCYTNSRQACIRPTFTLSSLETVVTQNLLDGLSPSRSSADGVMSWCFAMKLPEAYPERERYPLSYCLTYNNVNETLSIGLKNFTLASVWFPPVEDITTTTTHSGTTNLSPLLSAVLIPIFLLALN